MKRQSGAPFRVDLNYAVRSTRSESIHALASVQKSYFFDIARREGVQRFDFGAYAIDYDHGLLRAFEAGSTAPERSRRGAVQLQTDDFKCRTRVHSLDCIAPDDIRACPVWRPRRDRGAGKVDCRYHQHSDKAEGPQVR